ncbi:MAG: orotidine-5'-phosphate decarboxylase [Patescibacteria group bacterium]|nr:orotidine-5'-phosphate decarboxylase [Patescibacteria group bacterium]
MKDLKLEEHLIVAADFKPSDCGGVSGVMDKVLVLISSLDDLGVYIKINSVLRYCGYELIEMLHNRGLKVFADLKLIDIPETMGIDAEILSEFKPDILTVMCCAGVGGMAAVKKKINADCEVLGVTVLTSLGEEGCQEIFSRSCEEAVLKLGGMAASAGLNGLILSGKELEIVKKKEELILLSRNTPGIRPLWSVVEKDDQSRIVTPAQAIASGADRIVIGRPITQAADPREAVLKTLAEIEEGIKQLYQNKEE